MARRRKQLVRKDKQHLKGKSLRMEPLEKRMLLSAGYPGQIFDVGQTPVAIAAADFDGD